MERKDSQQNEPTGERRPPEEPSAAAAQSTTSEENRGLEQPAGRVIVAGIGASAGGLEALQAFFEALPENLGVAFVVIVHLSPEHPSQLAEILASSTAMPVQQVEGSVPLEGNHIYVIPPDRRLQLSDNTVGAFPFEEPRGQRTPIDQFFRSQAEQHGDGFAVILSGGGSDGASGVKAIKEGGGLILVQEPREAAFDLMPRAAIATGVVDLVLPVRELAARLADLTHIKRQLQQTLSAQSPAPLDGESEQALGQILAYLQARTGHDFSKYKRGTLLRRLGRRMQVRRQESLGSYLAFLRQNVEEVQALFNDLLISVTTFFRDPEAFQALQEKVIAKLFQAEATAHPIRVWVPGCATGEEVYSIAILLLEEADRHEVWPELQLFASDLDEAALAVAREGFYPAAIEADVSPERLRRFFVKEGEGYRVTKLVRDRVLFASHSLLKDPPFSRLDLISCRNLLIYLERDLQQQVFGLFRYALRPGGYLFLGASETTEGLYFWAIDKKQRLYQAREAVREGPPPLPDLLLSPGRPGPAEPKRTRREQASVPVLHQKLLETFAPPSLLVDEDRNVLHLSEKAGRFLRWPGGQITHEVTELVLPELQTELQAALYRAFERNEASLSPFVPVQFNGTAHWVTILVQPRQGEAERLALVFFLEGGEVPPEGPFLGEGEVPAEALRQLQEELRQGQARMSTMREDYSAANEELRATNEELLSLNEEYRTTTEELETSKEELQSLNEELQTVNAELKHNFDQLSRVHSDLENLMAATEIGTLFLDLNLRIQRFTPRLADLFNITPSDRGRLIGDFSHRLDYDQLEADARQVLQNLAPMEWALRSREGGWYLVRLRPYRTIDNRIDGVVVTFVDITERKRAEEEVQAARIYAESIIETLHEALLVLSPDLRVKSANLAFYEQFKVRPEQTEGRLIYELGNNQWDIPALRTLLEEVLPDNKLFNDYEVSHDFEDLGQRTMRLNGRRLDHVQLILLAVEDITERKAAEEALRTSQQRLMEALQAGRMAYWDWDPETDRTYTSDTAADIFGLLPGERLDSSAYSFRLVHPDDVERHRSLVQQAGERGEGWYTEFRILRPRDGELAWLEERATATPDPQNGKTHITGLVWDITERKRAEEALRASEERLRRLIESATDYAIFTTDPAGAINSWNPGAERIFGWTTAEALGQPGAIIFTPEDRAAGIPEKERKTARDTGRALDERFHLRKDSSLLYVSGSLTPLYQNNQLIGYVKITHDLTERQQMEEALRASEERLRLLIESVQDYAIFTLDPAGRVTSWNEGARRLKGYTAAEIIGQPLQQFYTPEDVAAGKPEAEMQTALRLGRSEDESWRVRKDGSHFWVNEIITPLRAGDGALLGFTKISRDLTERRQMEEALEARVRERTRELHQANTELQVEIVERQRVEAELNESEAQLRQMASRLTMAEQEERRRLSQVLHDDVQQLLYGIQLTLEFVRDGLKTDQREGLIGYTEQAATWIQDTITRTRQLTVDLSPLVLQGEGLADALEWLSPQMAELHGLQVEVQATQRFPIENEDMRVLLFQIIRELLFNVVKHAGTDQARVALWEEAGRLVIRVSDGGRGFQVEAVEAGGEDGFGLFSIRERLRLFGGRLEIVSRLGEGTQITVYSPVEVKQR